MKICKLCGKEFEPINNAQTICKEIHYRSCEVCGTQFAITRPSASQLCCSKECTKKKREATMIARHGVAHALQNKELLEKAEETSFERFGVKHAAQSEEVKQKVKEHFNEKYGVDSPFQMNDFADKRKATDLEKYGVEHHMKNTSVLSKMQETNTQVYGGPAPICSSDIRSRCGRSKSNPSNLEKRVHAFLQEYNIEYETEHIIKGESFTHSFDLYIPRYRILIDCDRQFYHGYLDDADGKWVIEENDTRRLELVPEGHTFLVIVEDDVERGLRRLFNTTKSIDAGTFDINTSIFEWCRSISFPYPEYSENRLKKDYARLCNATTDKYSPSCMFAMSSIRQFHRSIYDCKVGDNPSVREAWEDDKLLKSVIANRLIYQNDVNPSKVLAGFIISKIAPKVSVFNPMLARYLCNKYLKKYETVFDPFSGFSGRMLGVCSTGKLYIGQDLNANAVGESNQIINFHSLKASVNVQDIFHSSDVFDCLLTCPPYASKEHYNNEIVTQSCDDWIDECIHRFKCSRYVFVVDVVEKYKHCVTEEIKCSSYFRKSSEWVVVIDKDTLYKFK